MNSNKKNIIISALLTLYLFIFLFNIDKLLKYSLILTAPFLIIFYFVTNILFGFKKDKVNIIKKKSIILLIIQFFIYYIIIFILGILLGFKQYNYSFSYLLNIILYFTIIVLLELIRYTIVTQNGTDKFLVILDTLLLAIIMYLPILYLTETNILLLITTIISQLFLTYLSSNLGYKLTILYRLLLELFLFIFPIFPNIDLNSITVLSLLLIIYNYIKFKRIIADYNRKISNQTFVKKSFRVIYIPCVGLFILVVFLLSGIFPIYMIGIGSNSMNPVIKVGDAVIIKKDSTIKKDDIIVFEHNEKKIVHRVIDIKKNNNNLIYITKGDNNPIADNVEITIDNIKGKVIYKVPLIAYPAVKLEEFLK